VPRIAKDLVQNAAVTVLQDPVLADHSGLQLAFESQSQAWKGCSKRLTTLDTAWTPPKDDASIPKNAEDRKAVVRSLLGAMLDRENCKDGGSAAFKNRWGHGRELVYHIHDMEKVCWDILVSELHPSSP
jgi:hypothetical protein